MAAKNLRLADCTAPSVNRYPSPGVVSLATAHCGRWRFRKIPPSVAFFIKQWSFKMVDSHNTSARVSEMLLKQDPPRDPLTGRLLKDLTPRQLAAVLEEYPCLKQVAPELADPHAIPKWDLSWSPLLRDPAPVRHEPTKPEPRRHRNTERAIAAAWHEAAHSAMALLLSHSVV